jgi:hypothetical protein
MHKGLCQAESETVRNGQRFRFASIFHHQSLAYIIIVEEVSWNIRGV